MHLLSETAIAILALEKNYIYQICTTNNLSDGIELINRKYYDLILFDIGLPYSLEIEVFKRFNYLAKDSLMLILSSSDKENLARQAVLLGAYDYFLKEKIDAHWFGRALSYILASRSSKASLLDSNVKLLKTKKLLTQEKNIAKKSLHLARHDALTGLPCRAILQEKLSQAIRLSQRHGNQVALLFLDLNKFKLINDQHGHAVGDALLQHVAQRLKSAVRDTDCVFRQGGDEFIVLLTTIAAGQDAHTTAAKLTTLMTSTLLRRVA